MNLFSLRYLLTLFLIFFALYSYSKPDAYDVRLYQSYISGDMSVWVRILNELDQTYKKSPSTDLLFDITQIQYGYIGYLIGIKNTNDARRYLKIAESNIETILKAKPFSHDAMAIKGSLYAYHIALSPYKAPFLGPKSMSIIDDAFKKGSESPQVLIEKGNATHYAPSMFGGDPKLATTFYKKAVFIYESQNNGNPPQYWLYLNTLAQLAMAYEKANLIDDAENTYKKILRIAPDFKWVKDELYPKFLKKKKS